MLYRTTGEGGSLRSPGRLAALAWEARCARPRGGLATLARAAPPPCPAFGGARGGCGPRTPWSWAGAPAPLRGPPGPVAPPPAGLPWCARPWPPSPPLGRCGPCPAALPPARACSRRGPWPLRGRWPRPGPLLAAPGPPLPPPVGRPGYRHGPPRLLPPGGGWGGCAAPFRRRRPPEWGLSGHRPAVKGCASGPSGPPLTAGRWPDLC